MQNVLYQNNHKNHWATNEANNLDETTTKAGSLMSIHLFSYVYIRLTKRQINEWLQPQQSKKEEKVLGIVGKGLIDNNFTGISVRIIISGLK